MARRIELYVNKDSNNAPAFTTNYDDYGVILYYAFTINQDKAYLLYKAMINKYALGHDESLNSLSDDDTNVYLPINQIPSVISFINNDILPSLEILPSNLDMIDEWNVGPSLEAFLMNQGSFFDNFNIDDIDNEGYTVSYFAGTFKKPRDFFVEILNTNTPYQVATV